MLRIYARIQYGVLALVDLAEHKGSSYVRAQDIAMRKDIPPKFLGQILNTLVRAGIVAGRRGAHGGYRLAQTPTSLSMNHILNTLGLEGPSERCVFGVERAACTLPQRLQDCDGIGPAEEAAVEKLATICLSDLCRGYTTSAAASAYQI